MSVHASTNIVTFRHTYISMIDGYCAPRQKRAQYGKKGSCKNEPERALRVIKFATVLPGNIPFGRDKVPNQNCRKQKKENPERHIEARIWPITSFIIPINFHFPHPLDLQEPSCAALEQKSK